MTAFLVGTVDDIAKVKKMVWGRNRLITAANTPKMDQEEVYTSDTQACGKSRGELFRTILLTEKESIDLSVREASTKPGNYVNRRELAGPVSETPAAP